MGLCITNLASLRIRECGKATSSKVKESSSMKLHKNWTCRLIIETSTKSMSTGNTMKVKEA